MTPQQKKADELVERFLRTYKVSLFPPFTKATEEAIQCAIICVEEILEATKFDLDRPDTVSKTVYSTYWQSVLNELKSRV